MQFIKKFLKNNWQILLIISICEIANLFLFYHQGLADEYSTNGMYLKYISNFPASINDVRVEPLFVTLSFILAKAIGSPIISIAILKNSIIIFELFAFYKITQRLLKNQILPLLAPVILNFSFAFFSLAQNLLRNHLGNLTLLIFVFFFLKISQHSKEDHWKKFIFKKDFIICVIAGGLSIYAHILPSLIIIFALLGYITLLAWVVFISQNSNDLKPDYKFFTAVALLLILFIRILSIKNLAFTITSLIIFALLSKRNTLSYFLSNNNIFLLSIINLIIFPFFAYTPIKFIFFATLGLTLTRFLNILVSKEKIQISQKLLNKSVIIFVGIIFLQTPYILRLLQSKAGTGDYSEAGKYIATQDALNLNNFINQFFASFVKAFRVLFEYRLSSISFFFMFLTFLSIFLIFKKTKNANFWFILYLWAIPYLGSKVDLLFQIGVLSYRFSLMLIFPTIILIFILLDDFLLTYSRRIKLMVFAMILISFLVTNLPNIFEASILRDYGFNKSHQDDLSDIYSENFSKYVGPQTTIYYNGDSFSSIDSKSKYLNNITAFSSSNEDEITNLFNNDQQTFIIYDKHIKNISGDDIGSKINTNIDIYEKSNRFEKIGDFLTSNVDFAVYRYNPTVINKINPPLTFNLPQQIDEFNSFIYKEKDNVLVWNVDIRDNGHESLVKESIAFKDNLIANINYFSINKTNGLLYKKNEVDLFPIKYRPSALNVNIHVTNAVIAFPTSSTNNLNKYLEEYSVNELRLYGKTNLTQFSYNYLNRIQFKILCGIIGLILCLIVFFTIFGYNLKRIFTYFKGGKQANSKVLLTVFCVLTTIDFLFLNTFITQWLKQILNL